MVQKQESLALIINTASFERVLFALGLAVAELALNREVSLFFTYGGVERLKKGATDNLGDETADRIRALFKNGSANGTSFCLSDTITDFKKLGGKLYSCPAALVFHDINENELIEEVDKVRGLVYFLKEEVSGSTRVIYI